MSINGHYDTKSAEVLVPNRTENQSPEYVTLVCQYKRLAKESAASIVKLAETLVVAENKLPTDQFGSFCGEVGLDQNGSTYRKLMTIGQNAARFEPFYDRMPNGWTTLYKLASIENDEFDRVTKSERFSPFMTAKNIDEVLGSSSVNPKPAGSKPTAETLTIDLHHLAESDKRALYREIRSICWQKHALTVKVSDALQAIVDGEENTPQTSNSLKMEQAA